MRGLLKTVSLLTGMLSLIHTGCASRSKRQMRSESETQAETTDTQASSMSLADEWNKAMSLELAGEIQSTFKTWSEHETDPALKGAASGLGRMSTEELAEILRKQDPTELQTFAYASLPEGSETVSNASGHRLILLSSLAGQGKISEWQNLDPKTKQAVKEGAAEIHFRRAVRTFDELLTTDQPQLKKSDGSFDWDQILGPPQEKEGLGLAWPWTKKYSSTPELPAAADDYLTRDDRSRIEKARKEEETESQKTAKKKLKKDAADAALEKQAKLEASAKEKRFKETLSTLNRVEDRMGHDISKKEADLKKEKFQMDLISSQKQSIQDKQKTVEKQTEKVLESSKQVSEASKSGGWKKYLAVGAITATFTALITTLATTLKKTDGGDNSNTGSTEGAQLVDSQPAVAARQEFLDRIAILDDLLEDYKNGLLDLETSSQAQ